MIAPPYSNLSNNKITEVEDGAFEGASSVIELHLTANQIDSVRSGMFRGLEGLRMLWVINTHNQKLSHVDISKMQDNVSDFGS